MDRPTSVSAPARFWGTVDDDEAAVGCDWRTPGIDIVGVCEKRHGASLQVV